MCGRYYVEEDYNIPQLMQIIIEAREKAERVGETLNIGEIFPSNIAPVVAMNRRREKSVFAMKWGFSNADKNALIINARAETASQKPMFRDSALHRRCAIPAKRYFEWHERHKYAVSVPQKFIYMAGLYRFEGEQAVFCVLTTSPTAEISRIHSRMPLMLTEETVDRWIAGEIQIEEVEKAAKPDYKITLC